MKMQRLMMASVAPIAFCATGVLAATPSPPYANIDANGIDLTTGSASFAMTEGSIGSGNSALVLQRY